MTSNKRNPDDDDNVDVDDVQDEEDGGGAGTLSAHSEGPESSNQAGFSSSVQRCCDTNVQNGIFKLNKKLRSVVMSKTTFKFFLGFHNKANQEAAINDTQHRTSPFFFDRGFVDEIISPTTLSGLNFWNNIKKGLLTDSASNSTKETTITARMVKHLSQYFNPNSDVAPTDLAATLTQNSDSDITSVETTELEDETTVLGEANIPQEDTGGNPQRLDVTIGAGDRLLAFVEVGLTKELHHKKTRDSHIDKLFWEKVDQSHNYLRLLYRQDGAVYHQNDKLFEVHGGGTILFAVLVFDRKKTNGRIAIFTAERKGKSDYRVALIWRLEGDMVQLDFGYGAFISAVIKLKQQSHMSSDNGSIWRYLGPDCTKVTTTTNNSFVLRSYDNRVRETPRSPLLYKKYTGLKQDVGCVLEVVDNGDGDTCEFGRLTSEKSASSMIFCAGPAAKRGKVEVISVPFQEGNHVCANIGQAIQIAKWLMALHEAKFVHGDIRGLNLVFSDTTSVPIDFDFGGSVGDVVYPPGYNSDNLPDGCRVGKPGGNIERDHDFLALRHVLVELHEFNVESITEIRYFHLVRDLRHSESMEDFIKGLESLQSHCPNLAMEPSTAYALALRNQGVGIKAKTEQRTAATQTAITTAKKTPFGAQQTPVSMEVTNLKSRHVVGPERKRKALGRVSSNLENVNPQKKAARV